MEKRERMEKGTETSGKREERGRTRRISPVGGMKEEERAMKKEERGRKEEEGQRKKKEKRKKEWQYAEGKK